MKAYKLLVAVLLVGFLFADCTRSSKGCKKTKRKIKELNLKNW